MSSSAPASGGEKTPTGQPEFVSRAIGWVMLGSGALGLAAAFALTIDKFRLLEDPLYTPACTFDAVVTCTAVMNSDQAEAFGFPNPLIGLAGFGGLLALGIAVLAGAQMRRWAWLLVQAGLTLALVFVHWLFFQSVYDIEALCPYCMAVWIATIVAFVYVTLANLDAGRLPMRGPAARLAVLGVRYHSVVVIIWFAVLSLQILIAFWDHWQTLA